MGLELTQGLAQVPLMQPCRRARGGDWSIMCVCMYTGNRTRDHVIMLTSVKFIPDSWWFGAITGGPRGGGEGFTCI